MVVTTGALHGQPQPCHAERAHAVGHVFHAVFLFDNAALGVNDVVAIESRGDQLVDCRAGQQIASQLLGQEAVIGQVAVECLDHPIAPAPHRTLGIVVESMRVGIARNVQPIHRHALAVTRR